WEARYWLASARMLLGDPEAADETLGDARTLQALAAIARRSVDLEKLRADPDFANGIAVSLYREGLVAQASVVWGMAIAAGRQDGQTFANWALSLQHQGRVEEASNIYRAAAEHFDSSVLRQLLVYSELFCDDGEKRHAREAAAWGAQFASLPAPAPHANPPLAGRKVRIGYVAPSFAGSQLRQFVTPVFEAHDFDAVEVVLYPVNATGEEGWPDAIRIKPIGHLSDADAAELIRADGIDVLNDCWGHTAGSRLGVFARKPAPVQVAWINFFQTTGLVAMDYVLHAAQPDAPSFPGQFTEDLWPVQPVFTPFRPAEGRLPPAPTPALAAGHVTFGSFNHPAKLSGAAISAWAEVMRAAPTTRLLLKYRYFDDAVLQRDFQTRFAARGVAPERIVFEGHSAGEDYFRSFQSVDLMLDAWPCPGSTTTLEALSNGVPVLAMAGDPPNVGGVYARTILREAGLAELAAPTPEAFVERAVALAGDVPALDALRARVRPAFEAIAICDGPTFTRGLERAYAQMFARWAGGAA
ncbi:MAG: hypothetical protein JSS35_09320, partial [Proteobacteria bacterium]|nr:hypothetical protein [Pseudomonadota bacterium]